MFPRFPGVLDTLGPWFDVPDEDDKGVYFGRSAWGDRVKIGMATSSVGARVRGLRTACPDFELVAFWRALPSATASEIARKESLYHGMFADCRLRGEWFQLSPGLLFELNELRLGRRDGGLCHCTCGFSHVPYVPLRPGCDPWLGYHRNREGRAPKWVTSFKRPRRVDTPEEQAAWDRITST